MTATADYSIGGMKIYNGLVYLKIMELERKRTAHKWIRYTDAPNHAWGDDKDLVKFLNS